MHVIDVGQAVDTSHPGAEEFLASDAANITSFFGHKGVDVLPVDQLIELIKDPSVAPHPPACAERTGSYAGRIPSAGSGIRRGRNDVTAHAAASAATPITAVVGVTGVAPEDAGVPGSGCIVPLQDVDGRHVRFEQAAAAASSSAAVAVDDDDDDEEGEEGSESVATGPPGVIIDDYDLDELVGGKKGAVVDAIKARLAALER